MANSTSLFVLHVSTLETRQYFCMAAFLKSVYQINQFQYICKSFFPQRSFAFAVIKIPSPVKTFRQQSGALDRELLTPIIGPLQPRPALKPRSSFCRSRVSRPRTELGSFAANPGDKKIWIFDIVVDWFSGGRRHVCGASRGKMLTLEK